MMFNFLWFLKTFSKMKTSVFQIKKNFFFLNKKKNNIKSTNIIYIHITVTCQFDQTKFSKN